MSFVLRMITYHLLYDHQNLVLQAPFFRLNYLSHMDLCFLPPIMIHRYFVKERSFLLSLYFHNQLFCLKMILRIALATFAISFIRN